MGLLNLLYSFVPADTVPHAIAIAGLFGIAYLGCRGLPPHRPIKDRR